MMAASALVQDVERLHDRLRVPPPPKVARRVRALIQEALGLLTEPPPAASSHSTRVPLTPERAARYAPEPETLCAEDAAATFDRARRRGRSAASAVYASVGPLLTPAEVADRLGVTRATVHNWRQAGRLLAFHPNRHTYLYPAFQFASKAEDDSGLLVGLADVLAALGELSPLGKALWLQSPQPSLGGRAPVDVLRQERQRGLESVLAAAAAAYRQGG